MAFLFSSFVTELLALVGLVLASAYFYVTLHAFSYWKRRGVKEVTPSFPFGNFKSAFLLQEHMGITIQREYNKTNEPVLGMYNSFKPSLLINDPEIARMVFIKDFQHFHDRGTYNDEKQDPLSGHLFSMNGEKWKNLRNTLSPTFTSGKLKAMFPTLIACGEPLIKYMDTLSLQDKPVEIREVLSRHTTNIIASVAFGIDIDCIANPEHPFRKYGRKMFAQTIKNGIRFFFIILFPSMLSAIKMKAIDQDVEDFMFSMVKQSLEHREKNNVTRKDFFQLLVQLRNMGKVQSDGEWETKITHDESKKSMSINEVTAQAFIFLAAGFETSSTTMSFCLYELARNPEYQKRVQKEIDDVLAKHNGQVTYESVSDMTFLEWCIDETLRMYPALLVLNRECTKEWTIPNTDIVVEKGTPVIIPAYAMHHDPKYYPEPEKFLPERFTPENTANKTFTDRPYMPFGEGPRICIGMRLGKMQTKVGLVLLLQNYNFGLSGNTLKPLVLSAKSLVIASEGGVELKVTRR